jgi:hypothetical protein
MGWTRGSCVVVRSSTGVRSVTYRLPPILTAPLPRSSPLDFQLCQRNPRIQDFEYKD